MRFYLDVDDTLAAFRDYAVTRGVPHWTGTWYTTPRDTWTDEQRFIQDRTTELMRQQDFWSNIPAMPGASDLISAAAFIGPVYLLTALPSSLKHEPEVIDMVRRAKTQWAWQVLHVPPERIIVCDRSEKVQYAFDKFEQVSNVLIDDAEHTCREWRDQGGEAFQFPIHLGNEAAMSEAINFIKCL